MKTETSNLWKTIPGMCEEIPTITAYIPDNKTSDGAVVILPGGGYRKRAPHEGKRYAEFLTDNGITAFVVEYRVAPHRFPLPLLDARRGIKFARFFADKYGIDKSKIAIMGSSAGGHLAALTSTYFKDIETDTPTDEIDGEDFIPNAQILCYPVIKLLEEGVAHIGSGQQLLGEMRDTLAKDFEPHTLATAKTPPAFIWHTHADSGVNVINSLEYAKSLKNNDVDTELHVFPHGGHGLGLTDHIKETDPKILKHVAQWSELLITWLKYIGF